MQKKPKSHLRQHQSQNTDHVQIGICQSQSKNKNNKIQIDVMDLHLFSAIILHKSTYFTFSVGEVIARGCSSKEKMFHEHCETHEMDEVVEKFCYCSFNWCNASLNIKVSYCPVNPISYDKFSLCMLTKTP